MTAHEMKALIEQVRRTWPDDRGRRCMFYCDFADRAWPYRGQVVGEATNPRRILHVNRYALFFTQVSRDDPRPMKETNVYPPNQAQDL